jgi:hypothetical protein
VNAPSGKAEGIFTKKYAGNNRKFVMDMKFKPLITLLTVTGLFWLASACTSKTTSEEKAGQSSLFSKENLVAWCIVPFDSEKRDAAQRARMLHELGFRAMAWDWRQEHLPYMVDEIEALRHHDIALGAVWFWVDGSGDSILNEANEHILTTLEETGTKTDLWVSFPASYFEDVSGEARLQKAVETIGYIRDRAAAIGCRVALYNHGDWFGEPANQVGILKALGTGDVGLVYNFHHGHLHVDHFDSLLGIMLPYLWTVNLNGMAVDGPKILPIGQGDRELEMMVALQASGYTGTIGILGHVDDQDVKLILQGNLDGMAKVLEEMGDEVALKSYR